MLKYLRAKSTVSQFQFQVGALPQVIHVFIKTPSYVPIPSLSIASGLSRVYEITISCSFVCNILFSDEWLLAQPSYALKNSDFASNFDVIYRVFNTHIRVQFSSIKFTHGPNQLYLNLKQTPEIAQTNMPYLKHIHKHSITRSSTDLHIRLQQFIVHFACNSVDKANYSASKSYRYIWWMRGHACPFWPRETRCNYE